MAERVVSPAAVDLRLARLRVIGAPAVETMRRSLERKGQLSPAVAAQDGERLELVDGFKRQAAVLMLGWPTLWVDVVKLSAVERKAHLYVRNREQGLTLLEESLLVRELVQVDGLSQAEVGELLERHKSWVCRRLQFIESLSPYLLEDVRVGLLDPGSARRLAALPSGNQEEVAVTVERHKLTPGQTGRLIELWRRAPDETARRFVLSHPDEALAVAQGSEGERTQDPRLNPRAQQAWRSLRIQRAAADRLRMRCEEGIGPLETEACNVLARALLEAREATRQAWHALESLVSSPAGVR
jgi:hypothetical protein